MQGQLPEAIETSQRVLAFDPENVHALSNLIRLLCQSGRVSEAQAYADRRLLQMLSGEYPQLLPEWLQAVAVAQRRVPEEALPDLLDFGQARRELHEAISGVLGQRGRWLARLNPDWEYALGGWDERSGKPACAMLA